MICRWSHKQEITGVKPYLSILASMNETCDTWFVFCLNRVEARKAGVRGVITRVGTIIIPVPVTKTYRGLSENQAGHEETD